MEKSKNTWVDLGLPSGTLWKETNENGYYSYNEAIKQFKDNLPTLKQVKELIYECKWEWDDDGYRIIGSNGNSIHLEADGSKSCRKDSINSFAFGDYWTSTLDNLKIPWSLIFTNNLIGVSLNDCSDYNGFSVRLVENKK